MRHRCVLALAAVLTFTPLAARADVVLQWNEIATRTLTTQSPAYNPFAQARVSAIVQLAVFEAINAITREYEPHLGSALAPAASPIVAPPGASADAAAIAAAHAVLVNYFPGSAAALGAEREASLASIPDGQAKTDGIATGVAAAAALIAERSADGSSPATYYLPTAPATGGWSITPGCPTDASGNPLGGLFLNWADLAPFGVVRPATGHWSESFRPKPPPALTSSRYARDYNEVKSVGATTSTERPPDRALIARFYAVASPTYLFHMAARQLATARGDSPTENARNLALISMATSDSLVASFAAKYHYLFWRPITAIRAADTDGNPNTAPDAGFTPFITTPCFPGYPSNHASGSNAAAETMRRIYGAAGHEIRLSGRLPVPGAPPGTFEDVTLEYTSLKQICDDIDDARVYGGIHYRFDQDAGVRLGRQIGTYIYKNNLQPIRGSGK